MELEPDGVVTELAARHPRSYEQEDFVFDPLHYLSLLEQKTNALDQAAPLAGWLLPPVFGDLRRLLEARMGKAGKREYVQVLRLIESFSLDDVRAAISEALERGVIGFDAVKHLVLCRIEKRPPRLNLLAHPYLPRAEVATTSARSYMGLLNRIKWCIFYAGQWCTFTPALTARRVRPRDPQPAAPHGREPQKKTCSMSCS